MKIRRLDLSEDNKEIIIVRRTQSGRFNFYKVSSKGEANKLNENLK